MTYGYRVLEGETAWLIYRIMLQIILLLALLAVHPPTSTATADTDTSKKRKRRRDRGTPPPPRIDPLAQPAEALDLLFDRVAVWMMVAELDTGIAQAVAQGDGKRQGVELAVHRLWKHVIHPQWVWLKSITYSSSW